MDDNNAAAYSQVAPRIDMGLNQKDELLLIKRKTPGMSSPEDVTINLGHCNRNLVTSLRNGLSQMLLLSSFAPTGPN